MHFLIGVFTVATLWGCTNPFLRLASLHSVRAAKQPESEDKIGRIQDSLLSPRQLVSHLFTQVGFYAPFLINQLGSVVFYLLLGTYDVSIAVPVVNGLTLAFTALTEALLRRREVSSTEASCVSLGYADGVGIAFILTGVYLCQKAEIADSG